MTRVSYKPVSYKKTCSSWYIWRCYWWLYFNSMMLFDSLKELWYSQNAPISYFRCPLFLWWLSTLHFFWMIIHSTSYVQSDYLFKALPSIFLRFVGGVSQNLLLNVELIDHETCFDLLLFSLQNTSIFLYQINVFFYHMTIKI